MLIQYLSRLERVKRVFQFQRALLIDVAQAVVKLRHAGHGTQKIERE